MIEPTAAEIEAWERTMRSLEGPIPPAQIVHRPSGDGVYCECGEVWECAAAWEARNHKLVAEGRPPTRSRKQRPKDAT